MSGGLRLGGFKFIGLVGDGMVAELQIDMLRRDAPGAIFSGGDIDGRLKTLLDGLRITQSEDELHGFVPTGDAEKDRCVCLLTDDVLVTKMEIGTDLLLREPRDGKDKADVEIRIRVTIKDSM